MEYILFDIGGTSTRVAVAHGSESFTEPAIFDTPADFSDGVRMVKEAAEKLLAGGSAELAVGGVAGPMDRAHEFLLSPPNLPGWRDKPVKKDLEKALSTRVILENDTALVGLGEATSGAGKDYSIVVYVTVSTGVNGVRIIDKKIDRNAFGFEIGSQIVSYRAGEDLIDFEELVSGGGILRRTGRRPEDIADPGFWETQADTIAIGLVNTIIHWSPDVVILGGGLMEKVNIERVTEKARSILVPNTFTEMPVLVKAELGMVGGLWGALVLANETTRRG